MRYLISDPTKAAFMDDLDHKLIAALRQNARAPLSELSKRLGVSRGTVQNRLNRLLESQTILGFTVRLKSGAEKNRIRAITMIEVSGKNTRRVVSGAARPAANSCALQHEWRFRSRRRDRGRESRPSSTTCCRK